MKMRMFALLSLVTAFALALPAGRQAVTAQMPNPLSPYRFEQIDSGHAVPGAGGEALGLGFEFISQIGGATSSVAAQGDYIYVGIGSRVVVFRLASPNNPEVVGQSAPLPGVTEIRELEVSGSHVYAVAGGSGLHVVDVSDPTAPYEVGAWLVPIDAYRLAVAGGYAYVVDHDYFSGGLRIVDVSDPDAPYQVGFFKTVSSWSIDVAVAGSHAYLVAGCALRILDVSNPAAPQEVGVYDASPRSLSRVVVSGPYAYLAVQGYPSSFLRIVDVSDPVSPHEVGDYQVPGQDARDILIAAPYVYLIDWNWGAGTTLRVVDVSDPALPTEVGSFHSSGDGRSLAMTGAYLYMAGPGGLRVHAADPTRPAEVGAYNTPGYVWGVSLRAPYVYLAGGEGGGLQVVDVSRPDAPYETAALGWLGSNVHQVTIAGSYAYVAAGWLGVRILDITKPSAPTEVGAYVVPWVLDDAYAVAVAGRYAYVGFGYSGLRVVDVYTPTAPVEVGVNESVTTYDIAVSGSYAYVSGGSAGLHVLDVSDPGNPYQVLTYDTPGSASALSIVGHYAYLADGDALRILNISNPTAPHEEGSCAVSAVGVFVAGHYAYVAGGTGGVHVVDIANPAAPRAVGAYDTTAYAHGVAAAGEHVYVADGSDGLNILWFSPPAVATIPPAGGTLNSPADGTTYTFPAGTFSDTVTVTHQPRYLPYVPSFGNLAGIGHLFEVTATGSTGQPAQVNRAYTVTVQYAAGQGSAVEDTLALYGWDGTKWVPDPTSWVDVINNSVTATPDRLGLWAVLGNTERIYLPLALKRASLAVDLSIEGIEVTQAVQNMTNTVSLVEGRPTVVRVYARTNGLKPVNNVYLSLEASRGGTPLPGSPLTVGPWAVFPTPARGSLSRSFNVQLPAGWLSGTVDIAATVDPMDAVREADEGNNSRAVPLVFNPVPALDLMLVPINYTDTQSGDFYPAPTTDMVSDFLMRTYPVSAVSVTFHVPVSFEGDLSQIAEWSELLGQIAALKQMDDAPASQVYYGLIPESIPDPALGGLGYIGMRASIGLASSGEIAAHEIGHNFWRWHAPCGDPDVPDPDYPYPNASIGQYGLDVFLYRIWSPGSPDYTKDVMSYCRPRWFSDYNYQALYEDQRAHGMTAVEPPIPSLAIRVRLDGPAAIDPAYALSLVPSATPPTGEYSIELLDTVGRVLVSQPVAVYEVAEQGMRARSIYANVPLPVGTMAAVRLVQDGQVVAERVLGRSAPGLLDAPALEQTGERIVLRWGAPEVPALVRYTVDDGRTWTTVGLDVLGGELRLDPRTLPGGAGRFEIVLADTVPPVVRTVALPTALPDAVPQVWITGPTAVSAGRPLVLIGHGTDREDGALTDLHWAVDGKEVQAGQVLQLDNLTSGEHTIVLTVLDRGGHRIQVEHTVLVLP